uniref:transposase n=2 Tax=Olivibacter sitiensis TaxID=376470 RepID=UPI0005652C6B
MGNRVFDEQFKRMAIELSTVKGSVKAAAEELDMDPSLLSKWRNDRRYNGGHIIMDKPGVSEEDQKIRRLEKELKEAKMER